MTNTDLGRIGRIFIYSVLSIMTVLALAPGVWVIVSSFSTPPEIYSGQVIPRSINFDGYRDLLSDANLVNALVNTLLYSVVGTLGALFVGLLAAYPTARMEFPGREAIVTLFGLTLSIPIVGLIVPEYYLMLKVGLYNSRVGLALFYVALFFPLAFLILRAYLVRLPTEVEEAARVDGANYFQLLYHIILPLSRPALVTVAVVVFINIWNEFLFALVLAPSPENSNVQVVLSTFKAQFQFNVTAMLAGTTIVMLVPIIVFLFLQRYVVAGLTAGFSK
ncbi:carbohydrate ABC transporter permease [Ensifer adhaerens]|uniref:carbohydrate ABC transporter permease n=1 Tax=Ensifer adhaerens TaxID=106592 RepID=UPI001CBC4A82|nr:carbohydrate ABC transporter permease [Ensifer adhaerens]MBZ7924378.1 carbohydrate ABC transporter permease [Ensifer adhaerens]UAX96375.1 carbohydrate ABC transporter permease [Ensifer adhaerens]UAY04282.1 carbohydrate ABC transporter permease [Ensifer adhaerens]UAY12268.1 carbohydrate ABC transporter permease [Ensifer adhaerens]